LDKAGSLLDVGAVNAGDERDIFAPRQRAVHRAAEPERKRHADTAADRAAIGQFGTGQQADQRRFSGTIGAKNSEIMSRRNFGRYVIEQSSAASSTPICLGDP